MVRSEATIEAQKRYYQKTRETRLVKMRENARAKAEVRRIITDTSPEEAEKIKEENRKKYHRSVVYANKKRVNQWLNDDRICPVFKQFLKMNVMPVIANLPLKFFDMCHNNLAILHPRINRPNNNIQLVVNGENGQGREEGKAQAEAENKDDKIIDGF